MRWWLLLLYALCGACSGGTAADGMGGAPPALDGRYTIEDLDEECDEVEGLTASVILEATGLSFEGSLSWTDLETGYESSRTNLQVDVELEDAGTITCIPYRHYPGQAPEYARLGYDAVTLSMTTGDGLLEETGAAVAWLAETGTAGELRLEVMRALPIDDAEGSIEASPVFSDSHRTLVLVYEPSDDTPLGHVSIASESVTEVREGADTSVGVPQGYFPALE